MLNKEVARIEDLIDGYSHPLTALFVGTSILAQSISHHLHIQYSYFEAPMCEREPLKAQNKIQCSAVSLVIQI